MADVAHQFDPQICDRGENSPSNDIALDSGEPIFDLVEPEGIGGRLVQLDIGMLH